MCNTLKVEHKSLMRLQDDIKLKGNLPTMLGTHVRVVSKQFNKIFA